MADAAFNGAGRNPGLELWRIENFRPVKQPKVTGKFYTGDSYILLSTTKSKSGALAWNIHFWLGNESTHDEQGTAAYKSVELDDALGGAAVQYREVQGNESAQFLSYFKASGGVSYEAGGVQSGFKHVEKDVYETRLLHCKGKRTVRVKEVPVALASLNKGDVFILDLGLKLFIFNGPTANKYEKAKGIEVASKLNADERGGRAQIVILDDDPQNTEFWGKFGGFRNPNTLPEGPDDAVVDTKEPRRIYRISDASGHMEFINTTPANGKLTKDLLDTNDVFLVHASSGKIYLWIGRKSNPNEKKEATARAVEYLRQNGLPNSTQIERVSEGTETSSFKGEFSMWDPPASFGMKTSTKASSPAEELNVKEIMARRQAEETPVDDGRGKLKVWVIKDFQKVEVSPANYGEFFAGDSYILLYTYMKGKSEEHIIYFWLGNESTPDEKGAAALLTVELDDSMGGKPVQVRVVQGKEPSHFRQLFQGRMIVYQGGNDSGFSKSGGHSGLADVGLFHVKGTSSLNTHAVQVTTAAASLNSQDCFVLVTDSNVFVWSGTASNESEKSVAMNIGTILAGKYQGRAGRAVVPVNEGAEPEEFWSALGGKSDYASVAPGEPVPRDARLFSASTATGRFQVEPIDNFDQSDLNDEDVFLLDTYTQLFVWIGTQSTEEEKKKAVEFAQKYVAEADDGRDPDIPIVRVNAGQEPTMFSCHFVGWDNEYTQKRAFKDPYQAKLDAMAAEKAKAAAMSAPAKGAATPAPAPAATASVAFANPASKKFPLDALKGSIPEGVDPTQKEEYLDDATFQTVFGMNRQAFKALPKWKRDEAKKKQGLF